MFVGDINNVNDAIPQNVPPPPKHLLRRNSSLTKHPQTISIPHVNPMSINQNSQLDFNRSNHLGMLVTSGGIQQQSTPQQQSIQQQQQQQQQQSQLTKPDLFNFSNNPIPAVIDDNNVKHQQTSLASNKNNNAQHDSGKNCQQKLTYPLILCDDHQLYDKENSFYLYHHDPTTYLPNYENLSTSNKYPDKFNTIECHGNDGVQAFPLQHFNIPISKMHASTCNLNNQFNSSNLINGHHFSNSLNNFHMMDSHAQIPNYYNFNPSFTQLPDTIHRSGGGMPMGAFGSSSIIGSSFASNISLNGTPKQQVNNMSWKHRNCSSRSSSSGTNSSSKFKYNFSLYFLLLSITLR
jgi:hypothetical protein